MIQVVILAAGLGKRMRSSIPKVLQPLAGKPLLSYVIEAARCVSDQAPIVVVGHLKTQIQDQYRDEKIVWVHQASQFGTAHALQMALPEIKKDCQVLILCGDVPLINPETLNTLIRSTPRDGIGMLTAFLGQPKGYGRIIRDAEKVTKIVEEKDANEREREVKEINPGVYLIPSTLLKDFLPAIQNNNVQKEFYLTDIIAKAVAASIPITTETVEDVHEILGVNDQCQLAELERHYQYGLAKKLLREGARLADPKRLDIRGEVTIGKDVFIDVNVILEGNVHFSDEVSIGANCVIKNTHIGPKVKIKPFSHLENAQIGQECIIGPFARLRPGTILAESAHVGNFVEIKNAIIGKGTKINHLSYMGDCKVGKNVNIGAGTITCNYDGANKHRTLIGNGVLIGSDTQLIAPVVVGDNATIAAGSTITKDVPNDHLTLTHQLKQRVVEGWQRPKKLEVTKA